MTKSADHPTRNTLAHHSADGTEPNFVKPHMALEGQTPAQVAGIGVGEKNKWLELLKNSLGKE